MVRDLLGGARRFQDFQASLKGIAPTVLSDRLKLMEDHGLVTRRFYSEHPPRAEYTLTAKGKELGIIVGALAVWGSRHMHPQTTLVHTDCGHPVQMGYHCPHCNERVNSTVVKLQRK
jgi:DNA-binding HxlR family transcriptional regulator